MKPILTAKPASKVSLTTLLAIACLGVGLVIGVFVEQAESSNQNSIGSSAKLIVIDSTLQVPQFSYSSGFYKQGFYLEIKGVNAADKIYFTTDGTNPDENSEQYIKPLLMTNREQEPNTLSEIPTSRAWLRPLYKVFKGTIVKAIAIRNNRKSIVSSNNFFVHPDGRNRYSLPVINLTITTDDFFSYKNGIYIMGATRDDKDFYARNKIVDSPRWWRYPANYGRKGLDWERHTTIDYYETNTNKGFREKAGIRTHGNATRGYAQKSLRALFRKKYGNPFLNYNIFGKQPYLPLPSFLLKGFGQDQTKALFRDNLMQALIADQDFKLNQQFYQLALLFINAEYWGLFSVQERIDAENLALNHQISSDSIAILSNLDLPEHGTLQDKKHYVAIERFIRTHDLTKEHNYSYVSSKIDVDNLIDYLIANMYAANTDWPDSNLKMWRYKGKLTRPDSAKDGRWRWLLCDLDLGFAGKATISQPMVKHILNSNTFGPIFTSLIKNPNFQHKFFNRFDYHLNSAFAAKNVLSKIDELENQVEPEVKEHINRWRTVNSYGTWKSEVELLRDFARKRNAYQVKELEDLKVKLNIQNKNQLARNAIE